MTCTSPLVRQENAETGRVQIFRHYVPSQHYADIRLGLDSVLIPCNRCPSCKFNKARSITQRLMLEADFWRSKYFLTLTYDDEHLKYSDKPVKLNSRDGSVKRMPTLCKRDYQLFFKRLRRALPSYKFAYVLSGEYGELTSRPHYHAILFSSDDLPGLRIFHSDSESGSSFTCELFNKIWPHGFSLVCRATVGAYGYVGQYVVKKLGHTRHGDNVLKSRGYLPEFVAYSKARGGIGYRAFKPERDCARGVIYAQDITKDSYERVAIPRSFIVKAQRDNPNLADLFEEYAFTKKDYTRARLDEFQSLKDDYAFFEYCRKQEEINKMNLERVSHLRASI